ncbi:MAG: AtpZ/AtpI family protein [Deltaproteobacteria bacterium]|jgi:ATP synthase protein I|nr:AtpZ/AtpI family protein [Deltaproteobacteria bacterium]
MKEDTKRSIRELAYFSSIGLAVALSIFIGLAFGLWLDRKFGTAPWLMFVGLFMGIAAGYRNIGLAIRKSRKL